MSAADTALGKAWLTCPPGPTAPERADDHTRCVSSGTDATVSLLQTVRMPGINNRDPEPTTREGTTMKNRIRKIRRLTRSHSR